MAEKCMLCKKTMLIGEAYSVVNEMNSVVGYVHRLCLFPELKASPEQTGRKGSDVQ